MITVYVYGYPVRVDFEEWLSEEGYYNIMAELNLS